MKNIKLIATDLDGTLLLNGAQKCNDELFPLIEQLTDKGVLFCAASGRQYSSLKNLFKPVQDKILYLCENGTQVFYHGKTLVQKGLDRDLVMEICNYILEEGCKILVSAATTTYLLNEDEEYIRFMREEVHVNVTLVSKLEEMSDFILKASACVPEDRTLEMETKLKQKFGDRCQVLTSGHIWIDCLPIGVDKGYAIEKISEVLNIDLKDMVAFDDNENDRTMLGKVGHTYLMRNCNPSMHNLNKAFIYCDKVEVSLQDIINKL